VVPVYAHVDEGRQLLTGHRTYISVLFSDLRGFTAFAETAAPEELLELLREYHGLIGELLIPHGATFEHVAGDGVMVFFNDPVPIPNYELRAIEMGLALQKRFGSIATAWCKRGIDLGSGSESLPATPRSAGSDSRVDTTTVHSDQSRISPRASAHTLDRVRSSSALGFLQP
jgi:class 3 adenylate cyclase